ncbi:hypothetical protein N7516_006156 [Penicillium verrucosum]|uniref:uncharacterized protein n=1 Tax=Penicillium verrucosum TaxID=60171 RepID=UPI002544F772|nr:uncharacterized protein N7516_006156 [Penicillium verrucosum]KAJ5931667.1 hypothetical protein N7516_006156 [Penicillium verrucosum]
MEEILPQHAAVEMMPHVLGEVKFTSGKQLRGGRVLYWAFIELSKHAENQFFRPNRMFKIAPFLLPGQLLPAHPPMMIQEHRVLNEFGSLQAGDYCVKNGRTTRVTAGICNGSKAYCNWKFDERYNPSGDLVVMATEATEEFIIVTEESQLDARWRWTFGL